ncbi:MAG: lysylphosphatidylglycerol synthase transmembrane domain-containing protein [Planctomycetota bacterium]
MSSKVKKWIWFFIKLAIVGGLVSWLILGGALDFNEFKKMCREIHWGFFFLGFFHFPIVIAIGVIRWRWLLAAQGIHISFWAAFKLTFIGFFFNMFIPGATGGDVVKAYYIARLNPDKKAEAATTVFIDRALGMYGLLLVGFVALAINAKFFLSNNALRTIALFLFALICGSVVFAVVFFSRKIRKFLRLEAILERFKAGGIIRRIDDTVFLYRYKKKLVITVILLSIVAHLSTLTSTLIWGKSIGINYTGKEAHISAGRFYVVGSVALFLNAMPVSPGGLGSGEAFYAGTFKLYAKGMKFSADKTTWLTTRATAIAVLMHIAAYAVMVWGAIPYFFARKMIAEAREKGEELEDAHVEKEDNGDSEKDGPGPA